MHLYRGLLSCLFFFRSTKFCLYSPFSGYYVFEPIGFPCFRCVLDSFTNFPKRTSICARILKSGYLALSLSLLMNAFCKFLQMNDPLNFYFILVYMRIKMRHHRCIPSNLLSFFKNRLFFL